MKRKLSALILVLVMMLNILPLNVFATETYGLGIDKTDVAPGESFTVTLDVPAFAEISNWDIKIDFDNTICEVVSINNPTIDGIASVYSNVSEANTAGKFAGSYYSTSFGNLSTDAFTVTINFRVKDDATLGEYNIQINAATQFSSLDAYGLPVKQFEASDFDYTTVTFWVMAPPPEGVYVAGVEMNDGDYLANGASAVTTAAPTEGGYAYLNDGVLTLNNFVYEGEGFEYDTDLDYYAVIYSTVDLEIVLVGDNTLIQMADDSEIIISNDLTFSGTGCLTAEGVYGITVYGTLTIDGGAISVETDFGCAIWVDDDIEINNGELEIVSVYGGIISENGTVSINGGTIDVNAFTMIRRTKKTMQRSSPLPSLAQA